jgi:hypothetical protein
MDQEEIKVQSSEVPVKSKRGRKPKKPIVEESKNNLEETLENNQEQVPSEESQGPQGPRKRGRRKKYVIDSIKRLRETDEKKEDKIIFSSNNDHLDNLNPTQVSFGLLNVIKYSAPETDKQELRKIFDSAFNISQSEKVPNIILQEDGKSDIRSQTSSVDTFPKKSININNFFKKNELKNELNNDLESENSFAIPLDDDSKEIQKDKKILSQLPQYRSVKKIHNILGKFVETFEKNSEWPEKTNIFCWWCCHPFDNEPVPCPINYNEITDKFLVKGIFCGWSCAAAFSLEKYKTLNFVYSLKNNIYSEDEFRKIPIAPDKICLKNFGGPLSIEEYRNLGYSLENESKKNHEVQLSTDNISYINQEILETYIELKKKN